MASPVEQLKTDILNSIHDTNRRVFFLCPNCTSPSIPLLLSVKPKGDSLEIRFKCSCGVHELPISSYIEQINTYKLSSDMKCNSRSHPSKEPDLYCSDCDKAYCIDCYLIHQDFFKDHLVFTCKPNLTLKCNTHNQEYSSFCNDCKELLCEECENEHEKHILFSQEDFQKKIKKLHINSFRKVNELISFYINTINTHHEEFIANCSEEEKKKELSEEYEKTMKRLHNEKLFIEGVFADYVMTDSLCCINNILSIGSILPLFFDDKTKNDYEYYLSFLKEASLIDSRPKISINELHEKLFSINARKDFDLNKIKRIFTINGFYYGEVNGLIREGRGVQFNKNSKVLEGEFIDDEIKQGTITSMNYKYTGKIENELENDTDATAYYIDGTYSGPYKDGLREGVIGEMKYNNNDKYYGSWKNDMKNGCGNFIAENMDSYNGEWKDNKKNGIGALTTRYFKYIGEFYENKFNGIGRYFQMEGGVFVEKYKGQWKNNKKNGFGIEYLDKDTYEGEFIDDIFNGFGLYIREDKSSYEGEWKDGNFNGIGIQILETFQRYEGEFIDGSYNGIGMKTFPGNVSYQGEWKEDSFEGYGILIKKTEVYEGEFKNHRMNGYGTLIIEGKDKYAGQFSNNTMRGYGVMEYGNRDIYSGEWLEGLKNGNGKYTFSNGATYKGNWKNDFAEGRGLFSNFITNVNSVIKFSGRGIKLTTSCLSYDGNWIGGEIFGKGEMKWSTGESYKGEWKNGKRHGRGVNLWENDQEVYEGEFENNTFKGKGTYKYSNGEVYEGEWLNSKYNGKGTYIAAGIMEYKGDFKDNYFEGEGTLIIYNGSTYTGQFYHDKYHGKGVITTTIKKENSKPIEQKFDGTFDNGVGKGTYYLGDGNKLIEVTWKNNKLKDGECIKVYPQGNKERGYWKEGHFTAK